MPKFLRNVLVLRIILRNHHRNSTRACTGHFRIGALGREPHYMPRNTPDSSKSKKSSRLKSKNSSKDEVRSHDGLDGSDWPEGHGDDIVLQKPEPSYTPSSLSNSSYS